MDTVTLFGTIGASLILLAFVMNQLYYWRNESFIYDLINFLGSTILVIYAMILGSYPFAILNLVWALVSLRDCFHDLSRK